MQQQLHKHNITAFVICINLKHVGLFTEFGIAFSLRSLKFKLKK